MIKIAVVMPVCIAFRDAVISLSRIHTRYLWTPFIAPQWEQNDAISRAWNVYASKAFDSGFDAALIINDDAYVYPWTVDKLFAEIANGNHLVSGVATLTEHDPLPKKCERVPLDFACFMVSCKIFDLAGGFDENFYPAYFEDNDFHYRMKLLGLDAYGISVAQFFHRGSTTQKERLRENAPKANAEFEACRRYYHLKWGGDPGKEKYKHPYNQDQYTPKDWVKMNRERVLTITRPGQLQ